MAEGRREGAEGGRGPPPCCSLAARPPAEVTRRLAPGAADRPEGTGLGRPPPPPPLGGLGPAAGAARKESKGRGWGAPGRSAGPGAGPAEDPAGGGR